MKKFTTALIILGLLLTACTTGSSDKPETASAPPATADAPDLEITDVEEITDGVKVTIENNGTAAAGEFYLFFELSKDGKIVGEFNKKVSGVPAGEEKIVETTFSGTEYGLGYAKVDSKDAIAESDEENNEFGF